MKKILLGRLICPLCLPSEFVLDGQEDHVQDDDILEGALSCPDCGSIFPIQDAIW